MRAGIDKTVSANLRALEERNNQSVEALRSREARIATLSGREKTYEEAYLLHLRRQYLKSSYLLQADLNENGFHDSMWKLLAMNKEQMNQLEGFIDEYRNREEISAQSWRSLGQQFENAGKLEAANAVFSVIPSQP